MKKLHAKNLAKYYKSRKVVKDVSLSINSGEIVGLLGPNGAGKTTCFYMIVGLVAADHGAVMIDEVDMTNMAIHQRAQLGLSYLPQEASIFKKLSVADNIMGILELRRDLNSKARKQKLDELLEDFNVSRLYNNLGMSLSGGERRRVEIARCLAVEPSFILLDEPFAGVDPISVAEIKEIIQTLRDRGIGVLITDHNVADTLKICEKTYIVNDGVIIKSGSKEEILMDQTVREVYLGKHFEL